MPPKSPSTIVTKFRARSLSLSETVQFTLPRKESIRRSSSIRLQEKPYSGETFEKLLENNFLGKGTTPQKIIPGINCGFNGKMYTYNPNDNYSPIEVDPSEAQDFDVIFSPGLGGTSSPHELANSCFAIDKLFSPKRVLVYSPLKEGERIPERFREGLAFYFKEDYIDEEESENFFNKILKPRIFEKDGKLKNPDDIKPFILCGYSVGHRGGTVSHINYLHEKIKEAFAKDGKGSRWNLIKKYYSKITVVNIASPVNWANINLPKEVVDEIVKGSMSPREALQYYEEHGSYGMECPTFPASYITTINYRSLFDMGTAKPEHDFVNFHCRKELFELSASCFARPLVASEKMYVLGQPYLHEDLEDPTNPASGYKGDLYHHGLGDNVGMMRKFGFNPNYSEETKQIPSHKKFSTPIEFDTNREATDKDWKCLRDEWRKELYSTVAKRVYKESERNKNEEKKENGGRS